MDDMEKLWESYKGSDVVVKVTSLGEKSRLIRYYKDGRLIFRGHKLDGKLHFSQEHRISEEEIIRQYYSHGVLLNREDYRMDNVLEDFSNWRNFVTSLKRELF